MLKLGQNDGGGFPVIESLVDDELEFDGSEQILNASYRFLSRGLKALCETHRLSRTLVS